MIAEVITTWADFFKLLPFVASLAVVAIIVLRICSWRPQKKQPTVRIDREVPGNPWIEAQTTRQQEIERQLDDYQEFETHPAFSDDSNK